MNRFTASATGWSQRLISVSAVCAVAATVSLAGAPGAFATNYFLEFSLDGTTYTPSITGSIFREAFQYVPGAASGATLWIRNSSGEPARLSSAAVMVRSDPQLNRQLGLAAGLESNVPVRSTLGGEGSCTDVPGIWDIGSGEELELGLVVDLSADAPNETMNRSADFDVVFLLESQDSIPRQACAALAGSGQPPAGSAPGPGNRGQAGTPGSPAELVALSGLSGDRPAAVPNTVFASSLPEHPAGARPPQAVGPSEQPPAGIIPAGFQSTVEPIIRSLSGTLLIGMSVVFAAAVVLRLRNRSS